MNEPDAAAPVPPAPVPPAQADAAPVAAPVVVDAAAAPGRLVVDRHGTVLDADGSAGAVFGAGDALTGRDLPELIAPDEHEALRLLLHAAGAGAHATTALLTGRRDDGLPLAAQCTVGPDAAAGAGIGLTVSRWGGPLTWAGAPASPSPVRSGPDHLLSHDARGALRNAKNFIGIFARKIRRDDEAGSPVDGADGSPLAVDLLETGIRSIANADEMVDRVVWFTRLEHDPIVCSTIPVAELLDAAKLRARATLDELAEAPPHADLAGPVGVELHGPIEDTTVVGNRELLGWVITELLVNARKFGGSDAAVTIDLQVQDGWAELVTGNSGHPIDPSLAEDAFKLGRMLQARGERPGVGMGLPIGRRIATRHGGRLRAQVPGHATGATAFALRLLAGGPGAVG